MDDRHWALILSEYVTLHNEGRAWISTLYGVWIDCEKDDRVKSIAW